MSFTHYVLSGFGRALTLILAVILGLIGISFIFSGLLMGSLLVIFLGIGIILITIFIGRYFYWKNKVVLNSGSTYTTRYHNY